MDVRLVDLDVVGLVVISFPAWLEAEQAEEQLAQVEGEDAQDEKGNVGPDADGQETGETIDKTEIIVDILLR